LSANGGSKKEGKKKELSPIGENIRQSAATKEKKGAKIYPE
jgi:hypothetical protein